MLVADIVSAYIVILGMDIMDAYRFIVDLRLCPESWQEKIKFCIPEIVETTNHSIEQMTVVKEGANTCEEEEPVVSDM